MPELRRVLWSEGLFLRPQHLQQADLNSEDALQQRVRGILPYDWGLARIEFDKEALDLSRISVLAVEAVLPGGMSVNAPDMDALPADRDIEAHFSADRTGLEIYLGVPKLRQGVANVQQPHDAENPDARFVARNRRVFDLNTGGNETDVVVLSKNLKLLFGTEALADHDTVRIGELRRNPAGGFVLDPKHVPPCIAIAANEYLLGLVRKVVSQLNAKSAELYSRIPQGSANQLNFGNDVGSYGLLNTCNAYIPILAHYLNVGRIHPERLFLTLASLVAELATFHTKIRPADMPAYSHDDPKQPFSALEAMLGDLIVGIKREEPFVRIPLERLDETRLLGRVADDRAFAKGVQYILSAKGDKDPAVLTADIPIKIKVGSNDNIDKIVEYGLRGLAIRSEPSPPPAVPRRMDSVYFTLNTSGDAWDMVKGSRTVAIYVPVELAGVSFELFAVTQTE